MPKASTPRALRAAKLLLAGLLSGAAIAGCGSTGAPTTHTSTAAASAESSPLAKESPAQILKQSAAALASAKTLHMQVSIEGRSAPHNWMRFSGNVYSAHAFSLSFTENGLAASVVLDGRNAYMQASYAFWNHYTKNPTVSWMAHSHWFKAPPESVAAFTNAAEDFDPSNLGSCLAQPSTGVGIVGHMDVAGQPAIVLGDVSNKADHTIIAVAASGRPYPLLIRTGTAGANPHSEGSPGSSGGACYSAAAPSGGSPFGQDAAVSVTLSDFNNVGRLRLPAHPIMNERAYMLGLVGA